MKCELVITRLERCSRTAVDTVRTWTSVTATNEDLRWTIAFTASPTAEYKLGDKLIIEVAS